MTDGVEFEFKGLDELQAKLKALGVDMRTKGGRFALRKAAQVIRDNARKNAAAINDPKTEEEISKNIVERFSSRLFMRTGSLGFRIGVMGGARATDDKAKRKTERRRGRKGQTSLEDLGEIAGSGSGNPGGDTFYWRFQEFGSKSNNAQPFMRPAMDQSAAEAVSVFIKEYDKAADRAIRRAKKTGN